MKTLILVGFALLMTLDATAGDIPKYSREQWPHWRASGTPCINMRERVLIDAAKTVTLSNDGCKIERGVWIDPYTHRELGRDDMDIDHIVPLEWAHNHGGWRWTREQRADFANDPVNLIAVLDRENSKKSSSGPSEYLPPLTSEHCKYARRFVAVLWKYRDLTPGPADQRALLTLLTACPAGL